MLIGANQRASERVLTFVNFASVRIANWEGWVLSDCQPTGLTLTCNANLVVATPAHRSLRVAVHDDDDDDAGGCRIAVRLCVCVCLCVLCCGCESEWASRDVCLCVPKHLPHQQEKHCAQLQQQQCAHTLAHRDATRRLERQAPTRTDTKAHNSSPSRKSCTHNVKYLLANTLVVNCT